MFMHKIEGSLFTVCSLFVYSFADAVVTWYFLSMRHGCLVLFQQMF